MLLICDSQLLVVLHKRKVQYIYTPFSETSIGIKDVGVGIESVTDVGQFVVEEKNVVQVGDEPIVLVRSPFPDTTPTEMMKRWHYIGVTNVSAAGLTSFYPFSEMFVGFYPTQQNMSLFRWFRSDMEVKIMINAVPQQYGALFVTEMPWYLMTAEKVMSNNPIVMDINDPTEVLLKIPWRSPKSFCEINVAGAIAICGEQFQVFVNCPMGIGVIDTGTSSSVAMHVWARFTSPQFAGPLDPDATAEAQASGTSNLKRTMMAVGTAGMMTLGSYLSGGVVSERGMDIAEKIIDRALVGEQTNNNAKFFAQSTYGDFTVRQENVPQVSIKWDPGLETFDDAKEHDIHEWLHIPSYLTGAIFAAASTLSITCRPDDGSATRLNFISRLARFWRGSIKYTIMFITSPLITARFTIGLFVDGLSTSTNMDTHPNITVTVKGTTTIPVVVPYMNADPWHETGQTFNYQKLTIKCIGITQAGGSTSGVNVLIWNSAGPDFVYRSLMTPQQKSVPLEGEFQASVLGLSEKDSIWIGDSMPLTAYLKTDITTFESLCRRTSYRSPTVGPTHTPQNWASTPAGNSHLDVFDYVAGVFLAYKGGIRHRITASNTTKWISVILDDQHTTSTTLGVPDYARFGGGAQIFDITVNRVVEVENAFVCRRDFVVMDHNWMLNSIGDGAFMPLYYTDGDVSPTITTCTVSAGEDFRFMGICPSPPASAWPALLAKTSPLDRKRGQVKQKQKIKTDKKV